MAAVSERSQLHLTDHRCTRFENENNPPPPRTACVLTLLFLVPEVPYTIAMCANRIE